MVRNFRRRALAVWVVVALGSLTVTPVGAGDLSMLTGRVLAADGNSPRAGVVVALLDATGEHRYASMPSDERGGFRVESAPPGSYRLLAEAPEGTFLAARAFEVRAGENPPVALSLLPVADEGEGTDLPPPPEEGGPSAVVKGVVAGIIAVGAIAIFRLLSDDETNASDFL